MIDAARIARLAGCVRHALGGDDTFLSATAILCLPRLFQVHGRRERPTSATCAPRPGRSRSTSSR